MLAQLNNSVFITSVNYTRDWEIRCKIRSSYGGNSKGILWYMTPCNLVVKVQGETLRPYSELKVETIFFPP
jgi:hypothetical protein